jgi:hypothetical protein
MVTQTVVLELPEQLYRHVEGRAARAHRTIEDELLAAMALAFPEAATLPDDLAEAIASLALLDDEDLFRAARSHLATEAATELEELLLKRQREGLTAPEEATLSSLTRQYERAMLIRAQAAVLLKERGHDVSTLLTRR